MRGCKNGLVKCQKGSKTRKTGFWAIFALRSSPEPVQLWQAPARACEETRLNRDS